MELEKEIDESEVKDELAKFGEIEVFENMTVQYKINEIASIAQKYISELNENIKLVGLEEKKEESKSFLPSINSGGMMAAFQ